MSPHTSHLLFPRLIIAKMGNLRNRVATGTRKREFGSFPDRENTGNFVVTRGKNLRHI